PRRPCSRSERGPSVFPPSLSAEGREPSVFRFLLSALRKRLINRSRCPPKLHQPPRRERLRITQSPENHPARLSPRLPCGRNNAFLRVRNATGFRAFHRHTLPITGRIF